MWISYFNTIEVYYLVLLLQRSIYSTKVCGSLILCNRIDKESKYNAGKRESMSGIISLINSIRFSVLSIFSSCSTFLNEFVLVGGSHVTIIVYILVPLKIKK